MIYKKGYQETENVESTVTSKVKGIVMTNHTDPQTNVTVPRIWDTPDYVVPPQVIQLENGYKGIVTDGLAFQGLCLPVETFGTLGRPPLFCRTVSIQNIRLCRQSGDQNRIGQSNSQDPSSGQSCEC